VFKGLTRQVQSGKSTYPIPKFQHLQKGRKVFEIQSMTSDLTRFCHMCSEKLRWCLFSFYSFLSQSSDCRWSSNHSLITAGLCNRNVIIDTRPAK